jgi:acetyltransferase
MMAPARWRRSCARRDLARLAADTLRLADGRQVQLRAIGPQDAGAMQAFVSALTPRSRYRRFFFGAHTLSEPALRALTAVDQYRHVALAAFVDECAPGDLEARIVADARYVRQDQGCAAEIAIAVADDWQRQGLGRLLMRRLAEHARQAGVCTLFGYVLPENTPMQALMSALGARLAAHPQDDTLCLASMVLEPPYAPIGRWLPADPFSPTAAPRPLP